jgi:hypothetical protein
MRPLGVRRGLCGPSGLRQLCRGQGWQSESFRPLKGLRRNDLAERPAIEAESCRGLCVASEDLSKSCAEPWNSIRYKAIAELRLELAREVEEKLPYDLADVLSKVLLRTGHCGSERSSVA